MLKFVTIMQSILIAGLICLVTFLLLLLGRKESVPASVEPEHESVILESEIYYQTNGNKIYISDPLLGEMWLPVLEDVPACSHDPAQTVSRNGLTYYLEDEKITSCIGVDVSSHQEAIDWEMVKASGVQFAFLRCGYRTYGSGMLVVDEWFDRNMAGAQAAGLDVGVYFYSQAITPEEAIEEAKMAIDLVGDNHLVYPIVYDWEVVADDSARTDELSVDVLTECTKAFCDTVREAGFTPMVYQNKRTSLLKLDLPQLTDYDFWLAEYNDIPSYYYDYRIWQYCSDGHIPGIDGEVDINICYTPYS